MNEVSFLSRTYDHEVIQFGYASNNRSFCAAAAEISYLSDQLSRGSTLEEVSEVLGKTNTMVCQLGKPTIFTTAQTEYAIMFYFRHGRIVIVCFDENWTVCDYVFISEAIYRADLWGAGLS